MEAKLISLLYENYKLRIDLAVAPVKKITDQYPHGMIIIERLEKSIEVRYEGFPYEVELILKFLVAQIKEVQKVHF